MPLAKLITHKIINVLGARLPIAGALLMISCSTAFSQDNSPYSRYGIGDLVPTTNITSRGMGSISAAYVDGLSINYNNPATFGSFQTTREQLSKKMSNGRAVLDIGMNFENRTLREPGTTGKFTASNALFSHIYVGVPLNPNWGLSFGLRPISRISYKISKSERLIDPITSLPIDSAVTLNEGDGGSYLASAGVGRRFLFDKQSLSIGLNVGYMFGKKDYSTRRAIINDSLTYNAGNFQTKTTYGNIHFNAGLQYQAQLKNNLYLSVGAFGNWEQKLNASQDIIRETYYYDESTGYVRIDSVSDQKDIKGKMVYPSNYTAGFILEQTVTAKKSGWLVGVDFSQSKWSDYRFYGQKDNTLRDKWEIRAGGQFRPIPKANYFSNVSYRAGVSFGPDYIYVGEKLPVFTTSLGFGLPIRNFNRQSYQATIINLAFEFIQRGNNNSLLKENGFRVSAGFSLSDIWFVKRKYE